MLQGVPTFLQKAGLILMAAAWLPLSFSCRVQEHEFSLAGQIDKGTPVDAAFAIRAPFQAVQFHQLRLSGWGCWLSKFSGLDSVEPGFLSARTFLASGKIWLVASVPCELLTPWQFTRRAALHPRAPCRI